MSSGRSTASDFTDVYAHNLLPWFDLDLAHYQEQLVNGYTRMTPEAGLQIFTPDLDTIPVTKQNQDISIEWMKNRHIAPPRDITSRK